MRFLNRPILFSFFPFFILCFNSFSQKGLSTVIDVTGNKGAWINDIHIVNQDLFLVDGLYTDSLVLGVDSLPFGNPAQNFIAQFGSSIKNARPSQGKILGIDQQTFCVVGKIGTRFKGQTLSKFNLDNQLLWSYPLSISDSASGSFMIQDVCFDGIGNTYALFRIDGDGEMQLNNEKIQGPAKVIIKIDKNGRLLFFKMLSKNSGTYNKLKFENGSVCAYSGSKSNYRAYVMDQNLRDQSGNNDLIERCKFKVWEKKNYFRIAQEGFRPQRLFYIEKYNTKKGLTKKEVFRDTLRFQDEVFQYEILNLNKKEF